MDTFGLLMCLPDFLRIALTVIGYSPTQDGPGSPIIHGDGRLFIMVVGFMTVITVGYGLRILNGARDGLAGEDQMTIMDGRQ